MDVKDLGSATDQGQQQAQTQQQQAQKPAADTAAPDAGSPQKAARPEWLPETYFDGESGQIKLDDFGKHYGELAGAAKAETDRLAAYPQKVDDIKFTLPTDLELPEGVSFDEKNPQFSAFRQFIFDKKIDPAVGNEMLGMYAREKVGEVNAINARVKEEIGKLGDNGPARITALRQFWTGIVGEKMAAAVMSSVFTADVLGAHEKVMLALSNQNTQDPPGGTRDESTGELSDEEYEAMTPRQRIDYARSKQKPA